MSELEECKSLLHETVTIMKEAVENNAKQMTLMQRLLEQSESRIDRTNTMVAELAGVITELKDCYTHHLDQACVSRDSAMQQSTELLRRMDQTEALLEKERERYNSLMESILEFALKSGKGGYPGTSVNIKQ